MPSIPIFDQDAGDYSTFTLVRVTAMPDDGSEVMSMFSVSPSTGAISITRLGLDFEYQRSYTVSISAQDHVGDLRIAFFPLAVLCCLRVMRFRLYLASCGVPAVPSFPRP